MLENMKLNKYIIIALLGISTMLVVSSCDNFLEEDLSTQRNTSYFETNDGVESLMIGLYQYLRYYHTTEAGYSFFNYGTDEYSYGMGSTNAMWNDYNSSLSPSVTRKDSNTIDVSSLWDYMYTGINIANTLIDRVDNNKYTGSDGARIGGFGHFMRGFHYFNLVTQYGGVPLKLEPTTSVSFEFERASVEKVFKQIEEDFLAAYQNLPENASRLGEVTKYAAAHFLAKAYLWRASELNNSWNSTYKTSDLQNVIKYASEVISKHPLAPNFGDLWDYKEVDGPNEQLPEIVLSAQNTSDTSTWNVGGGLHFYTVSNYRDLPGLKRDIPGGREYNRLRTLYYSIYQFDLLNDSRVWKTFRTKMNVCTSALDKDGYTAGKDRALMFILNQPGDNRFEGCLHNIANQNEIYDGELNHAVATTFVFFPKGTTRYDVPMEQSVNNSGSKYYPSNAKYLDGSRESIDDSHCFRDGIIARSAEDYFFIAEAYIRQGNYTDATKTLQAIRDRAAWKAGEDREGHNNGGHAWTASQPAAEIAGVSTYCNRSSYYESNNVEMGSLNAIASNLTLAGDINVLANLPVEDQEIVKHLGYTSEYDIALCFLLNEKSREMNLELVRWVDLARTKTLIARVKGYNSQAAGNIAERHYLRPIPQGYLDVIKRDGRALTADEKAAIQNPGY